MPLVNIVAIPNLSLHSDMSSLEESNAVYNNQLAFNFLERELGIPPIMSANEMSFKGQIDKLSMVHYLTQIHDAFNERTPTKGMH